MRGSAEGRSRRFVVFAGVLFVALVGTGLLHAPGAAVASSSSRLSGVRALAGESAVLCVWDPVAGTDVSGYRIERATSARGPWRLAGTSAQARFVDRISTARPLYYRVRVITRNRRLAAVSRAVVTSRMASPADVRGVAGETESVCTWTPLGDRLVTGYVVESSASSAGPWTLAGTSAGQRLYDPRANGVPQWYRVRAVAGDEVTGTPGAPVLARAVPVPQGMTAIAGDGVTVCAWTSLDPSEAASYVVERASFVGGPWIPAGTSSAASFEDLSAPIGPAYYRVRAISQAGVAGAASAGSAAMEIPAPSGLTAERGAAEAACAWTRSSALAFTYRVERASAADGPFVTAADTADDAFREAAGGEGATFYRVRAMFGAVAGRATVPVEAGRVPVPTGLTAEAGDMRDAVAWSSAGEGVASYVVERAETASGSWTRIGAQSSTSLVDPVEAVGDRYYRVRAVGALGIEGDPCAAVANARIRMGADVSPEGGVLRAANGRMTLTFPEGAFASTASVGVTERSLPAVGSLIPVTPQFEFTAGSPLSLPAEVVVSYKVPAGYGAAADSISRASDWMSLEESTGAWVPVPTTIDMTASTLSASMPHFSEWRGAMQPHGTSQTLVQSNSCNGPCHAISVVAGRQVVASSKDASVCYACHAGASAGDAHGVAVDGPNIKAEFMQYSGAAAFNPVAQSRHPLAAPGAATTVSLNCVSCHDPHKDPTDAPKLLRAADAVTGKPVASAGGAPAGNAFCWACHGTKSNSRVNLGVPNYYANSGGDKKTAYVASPHQVIACEGCHEGHGSSANLNLVKGAGASACLGCHSGAGAVGGVQIVAAHKIVSAGGTLTVDTALPCGDCHGPHGSLRGNASLLSDGLGAGLSTSGGAAPVRRFCLTCHTTSNGLGWDSAGATYTAPAASARVEGLLRLGGAVGSGPGGVGQNWLRLRPATGHSSIDTSLSCYDCHGADYASASSNNVHNPATYVVAAHTGSPAAANITILGVSYGPFQCSKCHNLELGPEHAKPTSVNSSSGCSVCHPSPRSTVAPWNKSTCAQGGCHTAGSTQPMHGTADPDHSTASGGCGLAGCHPGGTSAAAIHSSATTTVAGETRTSCEVCHAASVTPTLDCLTCHSAGHPAENARHASTGGIDYEYAVHGDSEYLSCSECHTMSLLPLHANYCAACHSSSAPTAVKNAVANNQTGCTACHPSQHTGSVGTHEDMYNSSDMNCGTCHGPGCTDCHSAWTPVPDPHTTSDAIASYIGGARVTLSANDAVYGSFGIKQTYHTVDGGAAATGTVISIAAPAGGTASHTITFWSTDWSGKTETPHSATFAISRDTTAPTTTSDAQASYGGTATITFTATDDSRDFGVAATVYRLDGGAITTGSVVVVPRTPSGTTTHTLEFRSVDRSDNWEQTKTATFGISRDLVAPTTSVNIPQYTRSSWNYYSFNVTDPAPSALLRGTYLNTTDVGIAVYGPYGSGATVGYQLYAPSQGTHWFTYWSVDNEGNAEAQRTATYTADWTAPTTTSNAGTSYTGTATVTLTPTDTVSGVAATYWRTYRNSTWSAWTTGTVATIPPPASGSVSVTLYFYSTDRAGNSGSQTSKTFTVNAAGSTYTLTYAAGANGTISGTSPQTVASGGSGTAVTAVANGGYHFVNWSDASTANPRTDTNVIANKSVTANFAINTYTLTYTAGANGTIVGTSPQTVNHGAAGSAVTAVGNGGYHFVDWSDGSTANPRTDTGVTSNKSVTANFVSNVTYTITALAGAGGSISPAGAVSVAGTADQTFTITPDAGYQIVQVLVDGVGQGAVGSHTFHDVLAAHTISVTFAPVGATVETATLAMTQDAWLDAEYGASGAWGTFTIYANGVQIGTKVADGSSTWNCPQTIVPSGARIDIVADVGFTYPGFVWDMNVPITYTTYLPAGSTRLEAATWTGFPGLVSGDGWWDDYGGDYTYVLLPPATIGNIAYRVAGGSYTLTYTAGANGTISGASPQTVQSGASGAAVTAVANTGYHFVDWSDGSTANPRTDTNVTADKSVTANFTVNKYTLAYSAGADGTVSGATSQTVDYLGSGSAVTAVPNASYHFVRWSDGSTVNPRQDTSVSANTSVTALFAIDTYTLKYTAGANGTISGDTSQTVTHLGTGTAVTAVPNTGARFVNWSDGVTANPRQDTAVSANTSVTANFALNTYTLGYVAGTGGSLSGTVTQTVNHGGSGTPVTAVPDGGHHFVDWSDGGTSNPRTDANVVADISVTANFAIDTSHTLTYTAAANGTVTGTSPQTIAWAGSGTAVTAVADAGYYFVDWSDGSTANPRTDTGVTTDLSVTANFALLGYDVYSSVGANGSISPLGYTHVPYGATQTYTITPNAGYRVSAIQLDWDSSNGWRLPASSYTFTNVTSAHNIYAYFAPSTTRTMIYTYAATGYCAPYGPQNVVSGGTGPLVTATPYGGYHFTNWSDGVTANPRQDTNVTADKIVSPEFAPNTYTMTYAAGANGTLTGTSSQSVLYGSAGTTVTAEPSAGYHFLAWSDGVLAAARRDTCWGDRNVTAYFAVDSNFDVIITSDAEGYVSGDWAQSVAPGGSATAVTAVVNDTRHWEFSYWSDELGNVSYANPLTVTGVNANKHWVAHYYNYYTGSCPFLFTWDGAGFGFESDLFSTGKLGAVRSGGTYQKPNPNDYYVVENQPAVKGGQLELRLVEERPETDYLDEFTLFAVDVPAGKDLAAVKIPAGGSYQPLTDIVHSVSSPLRPLRAVHVQDGADVSREAYAADGAYVTLNPDREAPSYQTIELDPGDVSSALAFKLIVEGNSWTPETDEGKAIAAEIPNSARQKIEVIGTDGQWTALAGSWPKPAEMARPYLLDLTGKFPTDDHRVRLTFVFKTSIDSIRLDTSADVPLTVTEVPLSSAVLGHHGFDLHSMPGDIYDYVYGPPTETGDYLPGLYTRFGDVTTLLAAVDDKFVVFGGGDEVTMRFDPPPPPAAGMTRRYVVYANGYYKWANTDIAQTVDPLPFAAMSNYPYPATEEYPTDPEHQQYITDWNTRYEDGL